MSLVELIYRVEEFTAHLSAEELITIYFTCQSLQSKLLNKKTIEFLYRRHELKNAESLLKCVNSLLLPNNSLLLVIRGLGLYGPVVESKHINYLIRKKFYERDLDSVLVLKTLGFKCWKDMLLKEVLINCDQESFDILTNLGCFTTDNILGTAINTGILDAVE